MKKNNHWKLEVQKRKNFGISTTNFLLPFRKISIPLSSLKTKADFEALEFKANLYKQPHYKNNDFYKHYHEQYLKYKHYTFKQLKDFEGVLKLSDTCSFIHIIIKNDIDFNEHKLMIYHRSKQNGDFYPEKVKNVFKNNSRCMAVSYLYKKSYVRQTLLEKHIL